MSVRHRIFVLSYDGQPLTPTTPRRARTLRAAGVAIKRWSKFGTFGIQLTTPSRRATPIVALGVDHGTKFEGYAVVVGRENPLNVTLDLPNKKTLVRKLEERRRLRRARRARHCRRRPARFDNRTRRGFIAPSQRVIVHSRLKVIREAFRLYPITRVGVEDVRFNHAAKRWGANFSTVEIGKARIKAVFALHGATTIDYQGHQTDALRQQDGYRKTSMKSADKFTAHCSDSLALAVEVAVGRRVEPGPFLVVNDTYRPVRRRLHDTQPAIGGIRAAYSKGTVFGRRKGLVVGLPDGTIGQRCGEYKGGYRYYTPDGQRNSTKTLAWISSQFNVRGAAIPLPAQAGSPLAA